MQMQLALDNHGPLFHNNFITITCVAVFYPGKTRTHDVWFEFQVTTHINQKPVT